MLCTAVKPDLSFLLPTYLLCFMRNPLTLDTRFTMADPLSVAASIIALTHAAKVAVKACEKLSSLRHMSAAVCALGNEIVEVRLLVSRVDSLLVAHGQLNERAQKLCLRQEDNVGSLQRHSDNLKQQLLDLENLKVYRLQAPNGEARKLQWLRFQHTVEQKQQNLRQAKLDMSSSLAVLTSYDCPFFS